MENARVLMIEFGGFEYARFIPKRTLVFEVWSNQLLEEGRVFLASGAQRYPSLGVALPKRHSIEGFF